MTKHEWTKEAKTNQYIARNKIYQELGKSFLEKFINGQSPVFMCRQTDLLINLMDIRILERTRIPIFDIEKMEKIFVALTNKIFLPPIDIAGEKCDRQFFLCDGYHRYWASLALNILVVPCKRVMSKSDFFSMHAISTYE